MPQWFTHRTERSVPQGPGRGAGSCDHARTTERCRSGSSGRASRPPLGHTPAPFDQGTLDVQERRIYRLGAPFGYGAAELETALETRRFRPCGPVEVATLGWSAPLGEDTAALVHAVGGCLLLCLRKQERLLPSAAVAEAVTNGFGDRGGRVPRRRSRGASGAARTGDRRDAPAGLYPLPPDPALCGYGGWVAGGRCRERGAGRRGDLAPAPDPGDLAGEAPGPAQPASGAANRLVVGRECAGRFRPRGGLRAAR